MHHENSIQKKQFLKNKTKKICQPTRMDIQDIIKYPNSYQYKEIEKLQMNKCYIDKTAENYKYTKT